MKVTITKVFVFILMLLSLNSEANENDSTNNFYKLQNANVSRMIEYYNLEEILALDSVLVSPKRAYFRFRIPGEKTWKVLQQTFEDTLATNLTTVVGNKICFLYELEPKSVLIEYRGIGISVLGYYENDRFVEEVQKTQDAGTENIVTIKNLTNVSENFFSLALKNSKEIDLIKTELSNTLKSSFKKYETKFENYHFEKILDIEGNIIFRIANITNLILDESYFECLILNFNVQPNKVTCQFEAKYAGGLIWSPKESRYNDMLPKHSKEVSLFRSKLMSIIYNATK